MQDNICAEENLWREAEQKEAEQKEAEQKEAEQNLLFLYHSKTQIQFQHWA